MMLTSYAASSGETCKSLRVTSCRRWTPVILRFLVFKVFGFLAYVFRPVVAGFSTSSKKVIFIFERLNIFDRFLGGFGSSFEKARRNIFPLQSSSAFSDEASVRKGGCCDLPKICQKRHWCIPCHAPSMPLGQQQHWLPFGRTFGSQAPCSCCYFPCGRHTMQASVAGARVISARPEPRTEPRLTHLRRSMRRLVQG